MSSRFSKIIEGFESLQPERTMAEKFAAHVVVRNKKLVIKPGQTRLQALIELAENIEG